MSLTATFRTLFDDTGLEELNLLIFGSTIGVILCALTFKHLTMRTRITLVTLSALTFAVAFVVEDQILRYIEGSMFMAGGQGHQYEQTGPLGLAVVIGAAAIVPLCLIIGILVSRAASKYWRVPIITATALVCSAALSVAANALALQLTKLLGETQMWTIVANNTSYYVKDLCMVLLGVLLGTLAMPIYRQVRSTRVESASERVV